MTSAIDATKPLDAVPASKAEMRANFAAAKSEIEALQGQVGTLSPYVFSGMRNRLLNGNMAVDQRNSGAAKSVPVNTPAGLFGVDRWYGATSAAGGAFDMQQLTASPPLGFAHYLRVTVTTAKGTLIASDLHNVAQAVEGIHWWNMLYGTADALPTVLSFWVRASIAGTYSVSLQNAAGANSCVATYVVNTANVWEYKTVAVPGCLVGTWSKVNTTSIRVQFDLGSGSNYTTTPASTWSALAKTNIVGSVPLISTSGATLDITGVQLEPGLVATPFDYRLHALELVMCQRYFNSSQFNQAGTGVATQIEQTFIPISPTMRGSPSIARSTETVTNLGSIAITPSPSGFILSGTTAVTGAWLWTANYKAEAEIV